MYNKEWHREYYLRNKEKIKDYASKRRKRKSEEIKEYKKKYRSNPENKEKVSTYHKEYRTKNKEYLSKYRKKYYEENKEYIIHKSCKWAAENIDIVKERAVRRRMRYKESMENLTKFDRDYMRNIYRQAKWISDNTYEKHEVDHIIPLNGDGVCGLHVPWNLQILTKTENAAKGARYDKEF